MTSNTSSGVPPERPTGVKAPLASRPAGIALKKHTIAPKLGAPAAPPSPPQPKNLPSTELPSKKNVPKKAPGSPPSAPLRKAAPVSGSPHETANIKAPANEPVKEPPPIVPPTEPPRPSDGLTSSPMLQPRHEIPATLGNISLEIEDVCYLASPLNLKRAVSQLVEKLRKALADQVAETLYLQNENVRLTEALERSTRSLHRVRGAPTDPGSTLLMGSEYPDILSGESVRDAFSTLWAENRNLRSLLQHGKLLQAAAHRKQYQPLFADSSSKPHQHAPTCRCTTLLESALASWDAVTLYDTEDWLNRVSMIEADRDRLAVMVARLADRLARTEATIRKDPILCGAFHMSIAEFSAGDVISQMHDAFAQLAAAQVPPAIV